MERPLAGAVAIQVYHDGTKSRKTAARQQEVRQDRAGMCLSLGRLRVLRVFMVNRTDGQLDPLEPIHSSALERDRT